MKVTIKEKENVVYFKDLKLGQVFRNLTIDDKTVVGVKVNTNTIKNDSYILLYSNDTNYIAGGLNTPNDNWKVEVCSEMTLTF